jgi:hypothetical protein
MCPPKSDTRGTLDLSRNTRRNTPQTFSELRLRRAQLLEGIRKVFEFVVELFLNLGELLGGEGCEVDFEGFVSLGK